MMSCITSGVSYDSISENEHHTYSQTRACFAVWDLNDLPQVMERTGDPEEECPAFNLWPQTQGYFGYVSGQ